MHGFHARIVAVSFFQGRMEKAEEGGMTIFPESIRSLLIARIEILEQNANVSDRRFKEAQDEMNNFEKEVRWLRAKAYECRQALALMKFDGGEGAA
jgi:hypothetical protein